MKTTVRDIIKKYLDYNGYDGLYFPGECACKKEDICPCSENPLECKPGYLCPCDCGEHDWHIGPDKPEKKK